MKYCISYISNSGITMLNVIVDAKNRAEAIDDIKGDTGIRLVLSCVEVK